jgi:hypothetical protein
MACYVTAKAGSVVDGVVVATTVILFNCNSEI